jgi:hypothetical protein
MSSTRLEEARQAWSNAVERMEDLDIQLQGLPDETDAEVVSALEERFNDAKADAERKRQDYARAEIIQGARQISAPSNEDNEHADEQRGVTTLDEARRGGSPRVSVGKEPVTYDQRNSNGNYYFADLFEAGRGDITLPGASAAPPPRGRGREARPDLEHARRRRRLRAADLDDGRVDERDPHGPAVRQLAEQPGRRRRPARASTSRGSSRAPRSPRRRTSAPCSRRTRRPGSSPIPIKTLAGQQKLAQQLIDRSQPGIDQIIFQDLVQDYNLRVDLQVLSAPAPARTSRACLRHQPHHGDVHAGDPGGRRRRRLLRQGRRRRAADHHAARPAAPDTIVMHPRRWGWISPRATRRTVR